jgi:hypothetical protein
MDPVFYLRLESDRAEVEAELFRGGTILMVDT